MTLYFGFDCMRSCQCIKKVIHNNENGIKQNKIINIEIEMNGNAQCFKNICIIIKIRSICTFRWYLEMIMPITVSIIRIENRDTINKII